MFLFCAIFCCFVFCYNGISQVLKQYETLDNESLKGRCFISKWSDHVNSNFYFLLRREPLHSMVCMLSWWWAPWILWKDRGWKNSSEHCYFTSDENTFLIRICASQGLMRYSPLILISMIAILMVCLSSSSLALIYWRKPSNDDKWAIVLENVHHQRHILLCRRNTIK